MRERGHHHLADQLKHILFRAFLNEARLEPALIANLFQFETHFEIFWGKKLDKSFHENLSEGNLMGHILDKIVFQVPFCIHFKATPPEVLFF